MISLPKGAVVDETNPALLFIAQLNGRLVDLFSLSWEIFDRSDKTKRVVPVSLASGNVNLSTDRVGLGHYFARHTFAATDPNGLYQIVWSWQFDDGGTTHKAGYDFELLDGSGVFDASWGGGYALVEDMRDEQVGNDVSDGRLQMAILLASRFIDRVTGRFFEPRQMTQRHSGKGARMQLVGDPIIGLEAIGIDSEPSTVGDLAVDLDNLRVFNRHLSGMMFPDDRNNPKIEFAHSRDLIGIGTSGKFQPLAGLSFRSLAFPQGVQNVAMLGWWGYTDPDGTPFGKTPTMIRHATKMLVLRESPVLTDPTCRDQLAQKWRVTEERVRDQTIKFDVERRMGSFTGDPEIDTILLMHTRPPSLGAA